MKKTSLILAVIAVLSGLSAAQSTLSDIFKKAQQATQSTNAGSLSNDKITAGLKQALQISTSKAVAATGRPDGFLKNAAIKILLPEKLRGVGNTMRMVGMGSQVDGLEVGMNRAAEQAAPAAKQIFINALTHMTFADARQILSGSDTAATDYFKRTSTDQLTTAFTPIVHNSMENVGVIRQYDQLQQNPAMGALARKQNLNLDSYVVGKALDGIFYMLGQEEKKIRHDPAAQTTALLREVFGGKH
jgi:hypothetical protein